MVKITLTETQTEKYADILKAWTHQARCGDPFSDPDERSHDEKIKALEMELAIYPVLAMFVVDFQSGQQALAHVARTCAKQSVATIADLVPCLSFTDLLEKPEAFVRLAIGNGTNEVGEYLFKLMELEVAIAQASNEQLGFADAVKRIATVWHAPCEPIITNGVNSSRA